MLQDIVQRRKGSWGWSSFPGRGAHPRPQGTTGKCWRCVGRAAHFESHSVRQADVVGRKTVIKHARCSVLCKLGACIEIPSSCSYSFLPPPCFPSFLSLLLERSGGCSWRWSVSSQWADIQHLCAVTTFYSDEVWRTFLPWAILFQVLPYVELVDLFI